MKPTYQAGNTLMYYAVKIVVWVILKISFRPLIGFEIEGGNNQPRGGRSLFVCNHLYYSDTVVLPLHIRGPVASIAKSELFGFGFRRFLPAAGTIKVVREDASKAEQREVLVLAKAAVDAGWSVAMFPEGTRSKDGLLGPMRGGVRTIARVCKTWVYPVGIRYRWSGLRLIVTLTFGEPIHHSQVTPEIIRERIAELSGQELA